MTVQQIIFTSRVYVPCVLSAATLSSFLYYSKFIYSWPQDSFVKTSCYFHVDDKLAFSWTCTSVAVTSTARPEYCEMLCQTVKCSLNPDKTQVSCMLRISSPRFRFLAECCKRWQNQDSVVLVCFALFAFYRAMHFSAKSGIAIACRLSARLSVCLSVTLVNCDHIGWNSLKLISPLVSLGCSLFATPTWLVCSKGNTPKFGSKITHPPLLIWASETFDRKLRPNRYR